MILLQYSYLELWKKNVFSKNPTFFVNNNLVSTVNNYCLKYIIDKIVLFANYILILQKKKIEKWTIRINIDILDELYGVVNNNIKIDIYDSTNAAASDHQTHIKCRDYKSNRD